MDARETALCALIACRKEGAWSNGALKSLISREKLDRREAALATRLCYGVVQNRLLLDFYLRQLLTLRIKALHPVVHDVLQLGLYQIFLMDKIPPNAAVNESVALAKKYCKSNPSAAGLVNAVLRNALRNAHTLNKPNSWVEKYSHPQPLVDMLADYVGKNRMENMLIANNAAPDTVIQVNTLAITAQQLQQQLLDDGINVREHAWMPDCLVLSNTGNLEHINAFEQGLFYVQDAAAKLSVMCARLTGAQRVLDCCAAPGGKSFAAAIAMQGHGSIISCDIHAHKVSLIENGAGRLGISSITAMQHDASVCNREWLGKMDTVIADVPCSGYGIIRKKPDIRYKDPETMRRLEPLQLQILRNQSQYVKPGGVLMYSTCTLVRGENEGVVESFLQNDSQFYLEALQLPAVFPKNESGMLTLVPGEYDTDGFFICRLRRKV